ncbi:DUF1540 domain-containing protein [Faecalicatena sp. AGMB00832]|uniref:DUF1540 domain-containing protein n=1 Tax=Faecalicatena faecalis TaxID=2726362 RepID=A0ABS6D1S6_9FIRM|nr:MULTISPECIES: DUF1540 domain-containing protein [Faecalicatena]MBU3875544.1 DUF1540 domain-containing protein [Faecalicatena faecalis]MCI6466016.1 DUF1540 domain-containing protein [Faecalicatena sp.]MDY5620054.1 DUF1540 domain-containing protein [Lachnospiraceae bacterium]
MPELKCTVQTCVHNKQFLCDLDAIQVGGDQARTARETCCASFQERKGSGSSNSSSSSYSNSSSNSYSSTYSSGYSDVTGSASDRSNVDCKAVECMYNCDCKCHAGKISVEGSNACQCESTECATFKCK